MKAVTIKTPSNKKSDVLVDLMPLEKKALRIQARRHGITPSDFVRLALNQYLTSGSPTSKNYHSSSRVE